MRRQFTLDEIWQLAKLHPNQWYHDLPNINNESGYGNTPMGYIENTWRMMSGIVVRDYGTKELLRSS
jgi:hypothetical protein